MSHYKQYHIPFNKPFFAGNELAYISEAIARGHISGDGFFTQKCQEYLEQALEVKKCLLTTSCTHALEMAALLLEIQPGDEVILPTFTFVSTVNAFVLRGGKPIFIDIRPDTLNINEALIEEAITPHTKAIIVVHYGGVGCDMNTILNIGRQYKIPVIEDSAHALFAEYRGKKLGSLGCLSTLSFHETKNFICGEGGALLINDPGYIERAEILREKGTDRSRFFRGQVDKYTWVDYGSSYLPSDILAAFLFAQLEARTKIQNKRRTIWEYYADHLEEWARHNNVRLPIIPACCSQSYHLFYMLLPTSKQRDQLIAHLGKQGILSVFHYLPLHLSRMGRSFGGRPGDHPVAEDISARLLRLPFYFDLTTSDMNAVVKAVQQNFA